MQLQLPGFASEPDLSADRYGVFALTARWHAQGMANSAIRELCAIVLLYQWAKEYRAQVENERGQGPVAHRNLLKFVASHLSAENQVTSTPQSLQATFSKIGSGFAVAAQDPNASSPQTLTTFAEVLSRASTADVGVLAEILEWQDKLPQQAAVECLDEALRATHYRSSFAATEWLLSLMRSLERAVSTAFTLDPTADSRYLIALSNPEIVPELLNTPANAHNPLRTTADAHDFLLGVTRFVLQQGRYHRLRQPSSSTSNTSQQSNSQASDRHGHLDYALVNPPFGARVVQELCGGDWVSVRDPERLCIERTLEMLAPGGCAGVVVSGSFLCRGGATKRFRCELVQKGLLEAVISLPSHLFTRARSVSAAIVLLRAKDRAPADNRANRAETNCPSAPNSVVLIDGARIFNSGQKSDPSTESASQLLSFLQAARQAGTLSTLVSRGNSPPEKTGTAEAASLRSWNVTATELAKNGWDLSLGSHERPEPAWLTTPWGKELVRRGEVRALGECAKLRGGYSVKDADLSDYPAGEGTLGYFRIQDLSDEPAKAPTRWVTPACAMHVGRNHLLRHCDILLSRTGTIDKSAAVDGEAPAAIASTSLYVISADLRCLNPEFLLGCLRSRGTRDWLAPRATRTGQPNLTLEILEGMKIPVPSRDLQTKVVAQARAARTEVLDCLAAALDAPKADTRPLDGRPD